MVGLGVAIGVMFQFVMVLLGVPGRFTLTPRFFAACMAAGVVLVAMNHALARRVVGLQLAALTQRMRYVADVIVERPTRVTGTSAARPNAAFLWSPTTSSVRPHRPSTS
jgi:hypothetical protein